MNISGMIITYNEANIIEKPIKSLQKFCDEVVILDSYSDDGTPMICETLGCRVYQYEFDQFRDQKNRGISLCRGNWIFILDADEWVSKSLAGQISIMLPAFEKYDAINFARYNIERGQKKVGWPDYQTRLIKPYIKHIGNPIHPAFNTTNIKTIDPDQFNGIFIYQEKPYEKQEERYRMYYTLRAIDYKPFRLPENINLNKANYEDRDYFDAWTEWYGKERKFTEIKEFR